MPDVPESHKDLLQAPIAVLATNGPGGQPQVSALWFLYDDDGKIKISLNNSRQKVRNLQRDPRCTLFILDPKNPYRTLEIRARASLTPDPDYAFADHFGKKYDNADLRGMDQPGQSRLVVTLEPLKYNTWG
jgi:PPOX class probable F420-dependent enzyme